MKEKFVTRGSSLSFELSNTNNGLFSSQPTISPTGTLQYNEQASRASKRRATKPSGIKTDYDRKVEAALASLSN